VKEFFTTILYILITFGVFALTYYTTKYISKRAGMMSKSKNIQLMEKIVVGKDKQVGILRVGEDYILIGITNQSLQIGNSLSKETIQSLNYDYVDNSNKDSFSMTLENAMRNSDNLKVNNYPQYKGILSNNIVQMIIRKLSEIIKKIITYTKGTVDESKNAINDSKNEKK